MKKIATTVAVSAIVALMAGCGSQPPAKQSKAPAQCTYPNSDVVAPGWICDEPVEGLGVYAVGIHPKTGAGVQFQKDQAAAAARVTLAQQMKVHVANMVKQYAETTGAGSSETVDKVNTSVSKLITKETISGSKIMRSMTGPDGAMYVLVGLDEKLTQKQTEEVLKTSMKNERALWQQFKAAKGQDELAADIAKMDAK